MQKIFRRLSAALLCLALLAAPALAAEATIRSDYVVIEGENFVADTFCGVDALYNETGRTLFCNELIERFYSAVYGVSMYTDNGSLTVTSPSGCWFEVTYAPQPGDIAYASAEARERYGNHYAIVKSVDEAGGTVTLFEQNWIWDGKAGVNRVIPYDGGCYTFYTMMSASGRAAAAEEGLANTPVSDAPSVTPVSASAGLTAWGSGVSSITGTPSAWAADTINRAEIYGITMLSGRAAAAEEGLANTPVSDAPSVTPVSASAGLTAWGSGVSSITGTPSAWAADTINRAEIYGITMLSDGSYQSPITRRTLARLAANTARTLGLVEDVSDPIAVVQQLGVMQPNADGSFDQTSKVTRQMAATVLLRLLRQSSTVFDADYSTLSRYPDSAAISDWAREAVAMMTQYELMNGTSKGFEPKKEMTLEQCLVLLTRICEF